MCRLLGLIANKSVDFEFSLERFKGFSASNPDGWGIGWYEDNHSNVFKQGISVTDRESKLPVLSKLVKSKIIITHVRRRGKRGACPSKVNSHPFQYKNWLFAHNGSIHRKYFLSLLRNEYKNTIKGKTDSEVYFYWILQNIKECGSAVDGTKAAISKVMSHHYSGLNFILSDGKALYAFRYSSHSRDYYSLFFLERNPSEQGPLEFLSEETKALLRSKSLKGERAVLICSEKLTKENWKEIGFGKILIIGPDLNIKDAELI